MPFIVLSLLTEWPGNKRAPGGGKEGSSYGAVEVYSSGPESHSWPTVAARRESSEVAGKGIISCLSICFPEKMLLLKMKHTGTFLQAMVSISCLSHVCIIPCGSPVPQSKWDSSPCPSLVNGISEQSSCLKTHHIHPCFCTKLQGQHIKAAACWTLELQTKWWAAVRIWPKKMSSSIKLEF